MSKRARALCWVAGCLLALLALYAFRLRLRWSVVRDGSAATSIRCATGGAVVAYVAVSRKLSAESADQRGATIGDVYSWTKERVEGCLGEITKESGLSLEETHRDGSGAPESGCTWRFSSKERAAWLIVSVTGDSRSCLVSVVGVSATTIGPTVVYLVPVWRERDGTLCVGPWYVVPRSGLTHRL